MNTPPDDIDARLARREPLFRRAGAVDPLEPPAEVDKFVLARARAALRDASSDEGSRPVFFTLRPWVMPLGLAATLVFAFAVVVRLGPDAGAPAPRGVAETDLRRDALDASTAAVTPAPTADAPLAQSVEAKPAVASKRANGERLGRIVAQAEIGNSAAAEMPAIGRAQPSVAAAEPAPAPAPPATAAALAAASEDRMGKAAGGAGLTMPSSEPAALRSAAVDSQATPELWYRKIVELRSKGQQRAAEREWRALKARYPDFQEPPRTTPQ